jgi:hypothetical protein
MLISLGEVEVAIKKIKISFFRYVPSSYTYSFKNKKACQTLGTDRLL